MVLNLQNQGLLVYFPVHGTVLQKSLKLKVSGCFQKPVGWHANQCSFCLPLGLGFLDRLEQGESEKETTWPDSFIKKKSVKWNQSG